MKYTIKQKRGKYYKKFKPCGAEWVVMIIIVTTWIYVFFEVIRG